MSRRTATRLGWTMCGLTIACTVAGLLLLELSGSTLERVRGEGTVLRALPFPIFAIVGALIVSRHPENVLGWLFCGEGLSAALTVNGLAYGYVHYALFGSEQQLPAGVWVAWLHQWGNEIGFGLAPLIFVLFPTGKPPTAGWRIMVWSTVLLAMASTLAAATLPGALVSFRSLSNPAGLPGVAGEVSGFVYAVVQYLGIVNWLVAAASVVMRLRRAGAIERLQIKWFGYASFIVALGIMGLVVLGVADAWQVQLPGWTSTVLNAFWSLAVLTIPVSIGVAILRYRLYDIDLIIRRTLVYGALSALLLVVYWGGVVLLQQALRPLTSGSDLAIVASTLAVAALFQPLRSRIQRGVDRRFYRQRYNAARTLDAFNARLRGEIDLEALGSELLQVTRQTLQPQLVSLWLRPDERKSSR